MLGGQVRHRLLTDWHRDDPAPNAFGEWVERAGVLDGAPGQTVDFPQPPTPLVDGCAGRGIYAGRGMDPEDGFPLRKLVEHRRAEIGVVAERHGAISIALFGSVARGDETATSDVDFLVEFESAVTSSAYGDREPWTQPHSRGPGRLARWDGEEQDTAGWSCRGGDPPLSGRMRSQSTGAARGCGDSASSRSGGHGLAEAPDSHVALRLIHEVKEAD